MEISDLKKERDDLQEVIRCMITDFLTRNEVDLEVSVEFVYISDGISDKCLTNIDVKVDIIL